MPAKSPEEVKEKVLEALDESPRTVEEISKLAGTSWPGTRKALEGLERLGVVRSVSTGKRRLYYKPTGKTWFDLPIGKREKEILEYIFWKAKSAWKAKLGTEPGKTSLQKIAVDVDRQLNLGLPTFRYMYGKMTILSKPGMAKPQHPNVHGLDGAIDLAVEKYLGTARDAKIKQYSEEGMEFYKLKQEIADNWENLFMSGLLSQKLVELLLAAPDDENIHDAIKDFLGIYSMVQNKGKLGEFKYELWNLFENIWKEIALRMAYLDLANHGYTKGDLVEIENRYREQANENNMLMEEIENRLGYKIDPRISLL